MGVIFCRGGKYSDRTWYSLLIFSLQHIRKSGSKFANLQARFAKSFHGHSKISLSCFFATTVVQTASFSDTNNFVLYKENFIVNEELETSENMTKKGVGIPSGFPVNRGLS